MTAEEEAAEPVVLAEAWEVAVTEIPVTSAKPAAAASVARARRGRAVDLDVWVTCVYPLSRVWRRRMWVRPSAREPGSRNGARGIAATPRGAARVQLWCVHARGTETECTCESDVQPGPIRPVSRADPGRCAPGLNSASENTLGDVLRALLRKLAPRTCTVNDN